MALPSAMSIVSDIESYDATTWFSAFHCCEGDGGETAAGLAAWKDW